MDQGGGWRRGRTLKMSKKWRVRVAGIIAAAVVTAAALASPVNAAGGAAVRYIPLRPHPSDPGAVAPNALRFACFATEQQAETFFARRQLPFDQELVRKMDGLRCHLFYQPTIPGFRADPDNYPVAGLFFDIDLLGFITKSTIDRGDSLDILKHVAAEVKRPLTISIGVNHTLGPPLYRAATEFHFPDTIHRIALRDSGMDRSGWAQDYFKSGVAGGRRRLLVTRQIHERQTGGGDIVEPSFDGLPEHAPATSKLAWVGGDIQFVLAPRDPARLLMFLGGRARTRWGAGLTRAEYAYVMRLEFGADQIVDLSQLPADTDFFVSFLPEDNIALVAEPMAGNRELACEAATRLINLVKGAGLPAVKQLRDTLCFSDKSVGAQLDNALLELKTSEPAWRYRDPGLLRRLNPYLASVCGSDAKCAERLYRDSGGQRRMIHDAPGLLRRWYDSVTNASVYSTAAFALAEIVESQVKPSEDNLARITDNLAHRLEALGFNVIRVPSFGDEGGLGWRGVTYVNALLVDNALFVPTFGLGAPENQILRRLREQLPDRYRVIPVMARYSLLHAGGVHCRAGILRHED